MARLLRWPNGLPVTSRRPLTGPRTVGAATTESVTGYVQTTASPFGAWRWSIAIAPMARRMWNEYDGMVTALHGGANAVRVPFCNFDGLTYSEAGVIATSAELRAGRDWLVTQWSLRKWKVSRPFVSVETAASKGDDTIRLANEFWGRSIWRGTWLGFMPLHFGLYKVTEVIDDLGRYRIWPPLRKDIATSDYATLEPVMAMRLESEAAATMDAREPRSPQTLTLVEVEDELVRDFFGD